MSTPTTRTPLWRQPVVQDRVIAYVLAGLVLGFILWWASHHVALAVVWGIVGLIGSLVALSAATSIVRGMQGKQTGATNVALGLVLRKLFWRA